MSDIMWKPSPERAASSQMNRFRKMVNSKYGENLTNYSDHYEWSVRETPDFWEAMWEFSDPLVSQGYNQIVDDIAKMPGARWFRGCRLNFAENLLRRCDDRLAIISRAEGKTDRRITYKELAGEVEKVASALRAAGVVKGDRVAGFLPNIPESVITMLGAASIGAVWSSSSPDFGIKGVLDRFRQIEPKVISTTARKLIPFPN